MDEVEGESAQNEGATKMIDDTGSFSGISSVVTARGTLEGVVLRLDGRVSSVEIKQGIIQFLSTRRGFLGGNEVVLEWLGAVPTQILIDEIKALLTEEFSISVKSSIEASREEREDIDSFAAPAQASSSPNSANKSNPNSKVAPLRKVQSVVASRVRGREPSLFDGIEVLGESSIENEGRGRMSESSGEDRAEMDRSNPAFDSSLWDDPDARVIYATIRSGQKIETEHTLIIFGDVNSGAELVAGGDIIVLGTLRGTAHAGAYDEKGGGRVIFALNLQPTQLRIGGTISRGSTECSGVAEVARVEGTLIVVETYTSRGGAPASRQGTQQGSSSLRSPSKGGRQNPRGSASHIR